MLNMSTYNEVITNTQSMLNDNYDVELGVDC